MPVTEIALLRLHADLGPLLHAILAQAKDDMQGFTDRSMYFLQQTEDPSFIYIIGEWETVDQHIDRFIPRQENQAILESLKDDVSIEWLLHADVTHEELPLPKTKDERAKAVAGEIVLSVARHFVKSGAKDAFQQTFEDNKHYLQDFITEGKMGGGWRVDKEEGKEEWILLCPYKNLKQHLDFATTVHFKEYGRIREHIDGAEIKHAVLLDI